MKKVLILIFICYLMNVMGYSADKGKILLYKSDERLSLNRLVKDLIQVMKMDREYRDATFIIDGSLEQEVNINLKKSEVTPLQARNILEVILENYNYVVLYQKRYSNRKLKKGKKEKIVRIMQRDSATKKGMAKLGDGTGDDQFITYLIKLKFIRSKDIHAMLNSFSPGIKMLDFGNYMIVTDYASNVDTIMSIIKKLDVKSNKPEFQIIPLMFITSDDMEMKLNKTYQKIFSDDFLAISEPMTNSVLVVANNEQIGSIRKFVKKMDRDDYNSQNQFKIFMIKYGVVDEIRQYIEKVLNLDEKTNNYFVTLIPDQRMNALIVASSSKKMIATIENLIKKIDKPSNSDSNAIIIHPLKNANVTDLILVLEKLFPELTAKEKNTSSGDYVSIVGDERTNTLLITAPHAKRIQFERVINQLDIFPPQVMVEVLIVELSLRKSRTIGVEWGLFNKDRTSTRGFVTSQSGLKNNIISSQGMNIGMFNGAVDLEKLAKNDVNELSKIEALMALYQNDSDFDILSAPKIYVLNRKEAKIVVGEEIATPEGVIRSLDTGNTDVTNFKYKNVGINLTLTPVINDENHVTMQINQTITKRQEETLYDFQIPVFTKREAATHITIKNGETIVLAGMVSEDKTRIVDKTPFLGDIPLFGGLFKKTRDISKKTDLHIFITPHIVYHPEQRDRFSRKITDNNKNFKYHSSRKDKRYRDTRQKVKRILKNNKSMIKNM
ncbi:hypothetical protein KAJ27_01525 [bacterium]|nr:hypothetical protein [bacterium]